MPHFSKNTLFAFLTAWLLFHSVLNAQHPSWQNFTTRDGLPSNEIYGMLQDSRGLLWFSTDQGICHFNGYEFIRPVDTSATAAASTFQIFEDARGRIWFMHLDGALSIIENDTVRPWPYSHMSKSFVEKYRTTCCFAVGKDGAVWMPSSKAGFLVVQPDGAQQIVPASRQNTIVFSEIGGQIVVASEVAQDYIAEGMYVYRSPLKKTLINWQDGKALFQEHILIDLLKEPNAIGSAVVHLQNGDFLGFSRQTFYLIRDNQLVWHGRKPGIPRAIFEERDGSILLTVSRGNNQGLLRFRSLEHFQRDEFDHLLPGQEVHLFVRDHEGGWWVSSKNGVFYCKNPKLDIFDTADGLPDAEVKTLTSDGRGRVYAGLRRLDIAVFQHGEARPIILPRPPVFEMKTLRFDTLTDRLWCSMDLCFLENGRWTFAERVQDKKIYRYIPAQKITSDPTGTHWWTSSSFDFYSIDPRLGLAYREPREPQKPLRTFSITPDREGNLWVTTGEGLRLYRNGHYELPPFNHPALRFEPRNVELLPIVSGGGMVIALRGGGLLLRDKDGKFTHITIREGLTSDVLSDLDITPDGRIYACSNTGLNILSPKPDGDWRISTLTMKHGLPSNQINDVALLGDEIWIATDKGVARFRGTPTPALMPQPILEKFAVNNRDTVFIPNLSLPHDQNNLSLRFFALHFRSGGDIPYRYRLLGADTAFIYTHTREVNFAHLPSGHYTFEVQAQNEDGQWSEPAQWPFEILPPWWATWWFRALAGASLVVALYLFYQNRLQSIRREAAEREKIRDLETAALRAQMNPHFIFNCLQAIQSFIAKNDRDAAATYLARFAKLVRLALHGSVDGLHSLTEEIAMLENYLHLEQLRFRGNFEFSIRTEEGLDASEISLPPLLVQPFVENALIHGLQGRESGGLVEVVFAVKGHLLDVSVTDNGLGFSEKSDVEKAAHKSVGMMLTQKRLDLLMGAGKSGLENFARETVLNADGMPVGARVQILIPI